MENYWVPSVNHAKQYGRWSFAEFGEVYMIESDFVTVVEGAFDAMVASALRRAA